MPDTHWTKRTNELCLMGFLHRKFVLSVSRVHDSLGSTSAPSGTVASHLHSFASPPRGTFQDCDQAPPTGLSFGDQILDLSPR